MRFDKFLKTVAPAIAMAMVAGGTAGGCGNTFSYSGKKGERLADLDLFGDAPDTVNLLGPDVVRITEGADFSIAVEGSDAAKERMRFILEDGTLSILRDRESWSDADSGIATVTITLPAPRHLVMAGSGEIHAAALAKHAEVTIAGSGSVETPDLTLTSLAIGIAGSGSYRASGKVERLELSVAGSGSAKLKRLKADEAEVSIAGSGEADFSSDGAVKARILGSGNVTVRGAATCKVQSFGSGTLRCKRGAKAE